MAESTTAVVGGEFRPEYAPLVEVFLETFDAEVCGAALSVYDGTEPVVDVWGGMAANGKPWQQDTLCPTFSATKGVTALVCHRLAETGRLDLDAPVAEVWPEFAAEGKEGITTRMFLAHQGGLPLLEEPLGLEELLRGEPAAEQLARQRPLWEPGTAHGYHPMTYGWLIGETVRRATGRTVGELLAEEIARPLGLDFHIGLPTDRTDRVAKLVPAPAPDLSELEQVPEGPVRDAFLARLAVIKDPGSQFNRIATTNGELPTSQVEVWNSPEVQAAEVPAANGIGDARSLARMYAACLQEVDGVRLMSPETLATATVERANGTDRVLDSQSRFASGFALDSEITKLPSSRAFGYYGVGGAFGFADPETGLAVGYIPSQASGSLLGDTRGTRLIAALAAVER